MKTLSYVTLTALMCTALAGCNGFNAGQSQKSVNGAEKGKDTCGRKYFKKFMGTPFDDLKSQGDFSVDYGEMDNGSGVWKRKNRTYYLRVLDPRAIPDGEDMIILADYSAARLNVYVSKDGLIENLDCG